MMKAFPLYGEAKRHADKLVKDLAKGSKARLLTAGQARDALAAIEVPQDFYQSTGKHISLHGAALQLTEAASKLKSHSLPEAVDGFPGSVVMVKRISVQEAIEQFIAFRKSKTLAAVGPYGGFKEACTFNQQYHGLNSGGRGGWVRESE